MSKSAAIYMDVTSSNSVMTIQAEEVIPNPVQLQNFSADQMATIDDWVLTESRTGVDGGVSAGYIPSSFNFSFSLEANSPSQIYLTNLMAAVRSNERPYKVTITIDSPTLGRRFIFEEGTIQSGNFMPNPKKTFESTTYKFVFASARVEAI